jgi:hypothetical protein
MANYVIFSIDNVTNVHTLAQFSHHLDMKRAMQKLKGNVVLSIGSYKGMLEQSFILLREDFDAVVRGSQWIKDQESILHIEDGHGGKVYGELEILASGERQFLGLVEQVSQDEAMQNDGWTYRPDLNKYFTIEG